MEVLIDSGSLYNLMDINTAKVLGIDMIKLPQNAYLPSVSGGKLPIISKATVSCSYDNKIISRSIYVGILCLLRLWVEQVWMSSLTIGKKES